MQEFMTEDFLLQNKTASKLYHDHAAKMPVYDYHCHLPPEQIAKDINFQNLTQAWLYGDHYKWRAMRTNGIPEAFCTGDRSDLDKFKKWAQTVPFCLRNPLYHWTHLELKRYFGVDKLLNPDSAEEIYDEVSEKLRSPEFSVRNLLRKMNVKLVCTTEDPLDDLKWHKKIADDGFDVRVHTAWRPDKGMATEDVDILNEWIDKLAEKTDTDINDFESYLEAISTRHQFFHDMGCRISDHGIETAYAESYTTKEINDIFMKIRQKRTLELHEHLKFKSAMLFEFALMDHGKNWVQQFHFGALRNNNTRMFKSLGPDTGFDSIADFPIAGALSKFLDRLDIDNKLAKTIIYNLNPADNYVIGTMIGNFQDGTFPGKMQFGAGWWFLDQKEGIEMHIEALSNLGLLSRFVGMLTDSRSFLSFPRHEYFRRILCNIIGKDIENSLLPNDLQHISKLVENICYFNAKNYFEMQL